WFLSPPIAARLRTAAADPAFTLRRETPFTGATPLAPPLNFPLNSPLNSSPNPADWPTIRGVIDLLLVNRVARIAEIIDYKTDSLATWQQNAPTYRRQMFYYLRAASQILAFPVSRATLIYLTPKNTEEILFTS
ncbi:MAG: PD-(D/E)XK nuclease family protein, partial [Phycisphaerales bacterium]|nr:PD-(D/E)XK nuclease family protein [Phycisphaerales bacterium]